MMEEVKRVEKFLAEWAEGIGRGRTDDIHGLHIGVPEREAVLLASDIQALVDDRQRWINIAAGMGHHDARGLATKGWVKV
jgi:hypothetical protein